MTLKDQILKADDLRMEAVQTPEWGVTVYVPLMSLADSAELPEDAGSSDENAAALVVAVARNEDRTPIFTAADIPALKGKSMVACRRIIDRFNAINGFGAGDDAKKG